MVKLEMIGDRDRDGGRLSRASARAARRAPRGPRTPDPVPGPGELLLRTRSTAICASDVHYVDHPEIVTQGRHGNASCTTRTATS